MNEQDILVLGKILRWKQNKDGIWSNSHYSQYKNKRLTTEELTQFLVASLNK